MHKIRIETGDICLHAELSQVADGDEINVIAEI